MRLSPSENKTLKETNSMRKINSILLAIAFAVLASVSVAKAAGGAMNGWITDAKCAAKGSNLSNADCAKKCAEQGEKLVFVSDSDKKIISVDNQDALKGHEGHHVAVTGKVENGSLHVDKISMLEEPKPDTK
jgi:hypothetical protein